MLEYLGAVARYREELADLAGELGGEHRAPSQVEEIRIGAREVIQVEEVGEEVRHALHDEVDRARRGVLLLQDRRHGVRHGRRRENPGGERDPVGHRDEVGRDGVTRHAPNGRPDGLGPIDVDQVANEGACPPRMRNDDEAPIAARGKDIRQLALDPAGVQGDPARLDGNVEGGALGGAHRLERALGGVHVVRELGKPQARSELHAQELVRVTLREGVHEDEALRPLRRREPFPQILVQGGEVQSRPPGRHDHHDTDDLLQDVVRCAEGRARVDVRVARRGLLDLHGTYDLPPAVDDLLRSAGDEEVAVLVHVAQIAGVEPPALQECFRDGGFAGSVRDPAVPAKARLAPHAYGPLLAGGEGLERRRVEYRELGSDGHAGGARFVQAVRRRGRCNRHAFRHPVRGKHLYRVEGIEGGGEGEEREK